jgi:hypothetical protein
MCVRRVVMGGLCSLFIGLSFVVSLAVPLYAITETEALASGLRYRGGVRNAFDPRALKPKQLQTLLTSLRAHTGWRQLHFDADGFLTCPDETQFFGGSAAARQLLAAALDAPSAFDLENHANRAEVSFAKLDVPIRFRSMASDRQINVYPVHLDFADFTNLRGDKAVVAAFDIGLVLLHELAHGVWGLTDARSEADALGTCERYINQIRRELNLPERQHYSARSHQTGVSMAGGVTHYAELLFMRNDSSKPQPYYLQWDIQRVGRIRPLGSL